MLAGQTFRRIADLIAYFKRNCKVGDHWTRLTRKNLKLTSFYSQLFCRC